MDPEELVDVAAAMAHLRNLAIEWLGEDHACRINFYRYLSWCRVDFVSGGRVQRYSLSRLSLLASSLWNPSEDKARVATSLFACSKYARAQARLAEIRSSLSVF